MEKVKFNFKGTDITFWNGENVMVNATEMAKPFKKKATDWLKTSSVKEFLVSMTEMKNINSSDLVRVTYGNNGGTWMQEDVALEFARWLSPKFAIWCNDRIKELMKYGFTATPQTLEQILADPDLIIGLATQLKEERERTALLRKVEIHTKIIDRYPNIG